MCTSVRDCFLDMRDREGVAFLFVGGNIVSDVNTFANKYKYLELISAAKTVFMATLTSTQFQKY